jgi:hypothetical protein
MNTSSVDAFIFAILTTGAVLIAIQLARLLRAWMHHRTIREAISRNNPAVESLLAGIDQEREPTTGANDDRTAIVLIALGIALFLFGLIQGDAEDLRNMGGAALFPTLAGVGLLIRYYLARKRDRQG